MPYDSDSASRRSWTVNTFGAHCVQLEHLASNYIQPLPAPRPDGPAACEHIPVKVCQSLRLNSGALSREPALLFQTFDVREWEKEKIERIGDNWCKTRVGQGADAPQDSHSKAELKQSSLIRLKNVETETKLWNMW